MGTLKRTLRDVGALAAATLAVGASFGAITIAYGLPAWVPLVMSVLVFAGGAQFLAVGLLAAGNPLAAVLAGLLLNARHLPFGLAVADTIGPRRRDRLIGSHIMTDETVAFALAEPDPAQRRHVYWLVGATLFVTWNTGVALGVLLGGATGDPNAFGLDAAFPAGLIALILPSLRDRDTRRVALAGAAIAVLLTPILPSGLPVLCALLGLLALVRPPGRRPKPAVAGATTIPGPGSAPSSATAAGPATVQSSAIAPGPATVQSSATAPGPATVQSSAIAPGPATVQSSATAPSSATASGPGTASAVDSGSGAGAGSATEEARC